MSWKIDPNSAPHLSDAGEFAGLTKGHTTPPELDLLSPGGALSFKQRTGVEVTNAANFPAAGSFVDRGFNGLTVIGGANQGRVDALFPVPSAFPFG
jgi:hypothetical protein